MPHWIFLKLRAYKPTCLNCVNYPSTTFPHRYQHLERPNQRQNCIVFSHLLIEQNAAKSLLNFSGMLQNPFLFEKQDFSIQNQINRKTLLQHHKKIIHTASGCFTHCIPLLGFCTLSFSREVFTKFTWLYWGCCHFLLNSLQFCFLFKVEQKLLFLPPRSFFQKKKKKMKSSTEDVMTTCFWSTGFSLWQIYTQENNKMESYITSEVSHRDSSLFWLWTSFSAHTSFHKNYPLLCWVASASGNIQFTATEFSMYATTSLSC